MRNLFTSLRALGPIAAAVALLVSSPAAQAANPLELNFGLFGPSYDGRVAECERALPTIASQFQEKEGKFWNSELVITGFGRIHETAFRPWQSDNIPRRYCSGAPSEFNTRKLRCVFDFRRLVVARTGPRSDSRGN